jgi:hypothetical protein
VIVLVKTENSKVYVHYLYEEEKRKKIKHLHKKRGKLKIDCLSAVMKHFIVLVRPMYCTS